MDLFDCDGLDDYTSTIFQWLRQNASHPMATFYIEACTNIFQDKIANVKKILTILSSLDWARHIDKVLLEKEISLPAGGGNNSFTTFHFLALIVLL